MVHVLQTSRAQISARLQQLATDGADLYRRAAAGELMGPRELAQAIELNQQYVETLAELEDAPLGIGSSVTVEIDEKRVRFGHIDELADFLAERMNKS